MAELPDDISPFQIGTTGHYNHVSFTLIGRIRMSWEDGGWNEWFLWFDDGKKGWLAEAQGFLALSFSYDAPNEGQSVPPSWSDKPLHLGQENIHIDRQPYTVSDLKQAICVACEGELPSVTKQGEKSYSADLLGPDTLFASFDCDENWVPEHCFLGVYVEFDDLCFDQLRELPGWKKGSLPPLSTTHTNS